MRNSLVKNIVYNVGVVIAIVAVFLVEELVASEFGVLFNTRDIKIYCKYSNYLPVAINITAHILFLVLSVMVCFTVRFCQFKWWKIILAVLLFACIYFLQISNLDMVLINQSNNERLLHMLYAGIVQILLAIISSLLIIFIQRDYNRQLKKQILKLGMLHSQNEIEQIERSYTNTRVLKHDMKHFLSVILSLVKRGDCSSAEKEIESIIGKQLTTDVIHMQSNILVNAVVNNKINICKENDILYEVKLTGDISKEQEMNVAIILSNLIDNAIEAELKEIDRIIKLDMFPVKDMYSIVVSNKLSESVLAYNAGLKTTKVHAHEHGLGKVSVANLVNQMHGIYKYYEEDGYFITTVLFSNN